MIKWRKPITLLLCAALLCLPLSGCAEDGAKAEQSHIALMPLDSRPCNTQYPEVLAEACNGTLLMPNLTDMDRFTTAANRDALWQWLENDAMDADHLVIFTNTLFCGGLINSRNSNAYTHVDEDLARLEKVCKTFKEEHEKGTISVIQVLPRLHPNQYDDILYLYGDALKAYGIAWDSAEAAGNATPPAPADIPEDIVTAYRDLHETGGHMAIALNAMAKEQLIDQLYISQDDGEAACPANITFRTLEENQSPATHLIHGADELGMLLVANLLAGDLPDTAVKVIYSDDSKQNDCYPYEAVPLQAMVQEKLALAGLRATEDAESTLYLHCTTEDTQTTADIIQHHNGVLGIADIALTNQSDPALTPLLMNAQDFDKVDAYAGWNTAGNSIGTVCAMLRVHALLDAQYETMSERTRLHAAESLLRFRAIRYAEDLGFMTGIRLPLHQTLQDEAYMNDRLVFADEAAHDHANQVLTENYTPFDNQLAALINGPHTIHLGNHTIDCTVTKFEECVSFPWPRAFEIRADVTLKAKN